MAGAAARTGGRSGGRNAAREDTAGGRKGSRAAARRAAPPLEHRMLLTATLCLLAFGAVMVYSASSPLGVLSRGGSGAGQFVRYLLFGGVGLAVMHVLSRRGIEILTPRLVTALLMGSFALLLLVLVPGFGVVVNGARRWFSAGPIQFQPSEVMKLALVLYAARYLADHPKRMRSFRQAVAPIAVVAGPACLLIVVEPDLGTMIVVALTMAALLIAAGMPMRYVAALAGVVVVCVVLLATAQPYERARLDLVPAPVGDGHQVRCRLPGGPGADRARLGRAARGRAGPLGPEDLLPAGGADRLHPGRDRGGARRARHPRGGVPVRDDRVRRPADRAPCRGSVCEAAGDRADLVDSVPGDPQHLRRARARPAHRRAAAVHLLRADEPVRAARRRRPALEHRAPRARGCKSSGPSG